MKRILFLVICCLAFCIPNSALAIKDYNESNGDYSIFNIGDNYTITLDKIEYLKQQNLLSKQKVIKKGMIFFSKYYDSDTHNTTIDMILEFKSTNNDKILSAIHIYDQVSYTFLRAKVEVDYKVFTRIGTLITYNSNYLLDLINKQSAIIGLWRYKDIYFSTCCFYSKNKKDVIYIGTYGLEPCSDEDINLLRDCIEF